VRKPLVAGNWKMNGSSEQNNALLDGILSQADTFPSVDVALFPPAVYLQQVQQRLEGSSLEWGTQNVSSYPKGPFTGEISASMLNDFNCKYVLIGHSERRCLYDEVDLDLSVLDRIIAQKYAMAVSKGVTPIICIGETPAEHDAKKTEEIIIGHLDTIIEHQGVEPLSQTVLAYEPVWAIGTGQSASPEWAQEVHQLMRERIAKQDKKIAKEIRILYGGSVKGNNAAPLFSMPDVDGGLIGGASLDAEQFIKICQAAEQQI
jgi:triosephosphate isomerase